MKHFSINFKPENQTVSIHAGATILDAANEAGIVLNTVCGGQGTCGKCVVRIEPPGEEVLACQYRIHSDLTVTIPAGSRFFEQKILAHGIDAEVEIDPAILASGEITGERLYGLAVDLGTTTVVAKLINLRDGQCEGLESGMNPQVRFGDDVISRIQYASDDGKLAELHNATIDGLNRMIEGLCRQGGIEAEHIYEACVVGNTTMNHLLLKLPVAQLGRAPYKAYSLEAKDVPAGDLGLNINPGGIVHTPPNIAGFVGSDTTAVALAVDIDFAEEVTLAVDIGTNGELVLGTKDKLYSASCAAGPALEGARISCGSRGVEGAIEAVVKNGDDIDVDVIGNVGARSICGSGLIDAVAVSLDLGIIDRTGRFLRKEELRTLAEGIISRVIEKDGQPAFVLTGGEREGRQVILTQQDIRQVQLAKAAIRAGMILLERKMSLADADISDILLAGAFGNYIRRESALRIGLLPDVPLEKIRFVGNAASSGARMILLNRACRRRAIKLARKIEYLEIAHEAEFANVYAGCMMFP